MRKKAQIWGFDMVVAIIIFLVGILIFYIYTINSQIESEETLDVLFYEGNLIMGNILSNGYPENWTSENVVKIGILTDGKINQEKLENFHYLAQDDYSKTKQLFNTKYDYYFFLSESMIISDIEVEGIGEPGAGVDFDLESDNLIKINRVTIYKDKPVNAYLYVW
jgi:hypothetical protein